MFHAFLIKYGEIGIKGKNRYLFEDALVKQIRHALKKVEGEFNVRKEQGRIFVESEGLFDFEFLPLHFHYLKCFVYQPVKL